MSAETPCDACGFELFNPITPTSALSVSDLGLYDDARFPGRSILRLDTHEERLDDLAPELAASFIMDIQTAVRTLRQITGSERVNVAILGNAVPHLHAHLIPRYPLSEAFPNKSPWDDPRLKTPLTSDSRSGLIDSIRTSLG